MSRFKERSKIGVSRLKSQAASTDHPGRRSFVAFAEHVGPLLSPEFRVTPQLALFASLVEPSIVHGKGWLRLILVWPPGSGKTWTGKLFLAWAFGIHPDWHQLALCLSADLAGDIGSDVMHIIDSKEFRDVFPVHLAQDSASKKHFEVLHRGQTHTKEDEETGHYGESNDAKAGRGEFNAAGRSTRFTGRRGKILYQDDLLNEKEADSPVALKEAQNTIRASFSRGHPAGYHWLICNTRYRLDDPIGYILDKYRKAGPWVVVVLPTIIEEGEEQTLSNGWHRPLGDILYPYTADTVREKKETYELEGTMHEWYGQHKGMPVPPTGRKIDPSWFRRTAEHPKDIRKRCDRVVVILDTAIKDKQKNDPSGIIVVGQHMTRHYILDSIVDRLLLPDLMVRLARVCLEWLPNLVLVEETANGNGLIDTLRRQRFAIDMSSGQPVKVPFNTPLEGIIVSNEASKELRFNAVVPGPVRQGDIYLPESAPWVEFFISVLSNFPRVPHDELADCMAIWLKWAAENGIDTGSIAIPAAVAQAAQLRGRAGQGGPGSQNWLTRF